MCSFFFSSRRRHTRWTGDWSSDVCSSDLVGTEGVLGGQANVPGVAGTWKALTDNVNAMAGNLTAQVRNIADVTTAVARGRSEERRVGKECRSRWGRDH